MDNRDACLAFLIAECLRLSGGAMKNRKPNVTIDFKDRPIIRATNKACMNKSIQQEVFKLLKKIHADWTIVLDRDNEVLYISFK